MKLLRRCLRRRDLDTGEEGAAYRRRRLYEAVVSQFNTTVDITRSALEQWQPTLTEENIRFILQWRNVEAITPISFVTCCVCSSSLLLKLEQL